MRTKWLFSGPRRVPSSPSRRSATTWGRFTCGSITFLTPVSRKICGDLDTVCLRLISRGSLRDPLWYSVVSISEEVAALQDLHGRQGYLVIASVEPLPLGPIDLKVHSEDCAYHQA